MWREPNCCTGGCGSSKSRATSGPGTPCPSGCKPELAGNTSESGRMVERGDSDILSDSIWGEGMTRRTSSIYEFWSVWSVNLKHDKTNP